jgi:hypothetical protein
VAVGALAIAGALTVTGLFLIGGGSHGKTVEYWVAAVPLTWNIVPNSHDAIMGMHVEPAQSVVRTVV